MYAHTFTYLQREKLFVLLIPRQGKEGALCVFQYTGELQMLEWNGVEWNGIEQNRIE